MDFNNRPYKITPSVKIALGIVGGIILAPLLITLLFKSPVGNKSIGTPKITNENSNSTALVVVKPVLTLQSPEYGTSTTSDSVEVTGTLTGTGARLTLNSQDVTSWIKDGSFSIKVPLKKGSNSIVLNATLGAEKTTRTLVVTRSETEEEKLEREEKERIAKEEQDKKEAEKRRIEEARKAEEAKDPRNKLTSKQRSSLKDAELVTGIDDSDYLYIQGLFSWLSEARRGDAIVTTAIILKVEHSDRGYENQKYPKAKLRQDAEIVAKVLRSLHNNSVDASFDSLGERIVAANIAIEDVKSKNYSIVNFIRYLNASTNNGNVVGMGNEDFLVLAAALYADEPGWNYQR